MTASMSCYDTLGAAAGAPLADVKRAYLGRLRVHLPGQDDVGLRRVYVAHDVLFDPEARKAYGSVPVPARILESLNNAWELLETDPGAAVEAARSIATDANAPVIARFEAVRVMLAAGKTAVPAKIAGEFVERAPRIVEHHVLLAEVLHTQGDVRAAIGALEIALALGPWSVAAWIRLIDYTVETSGQAEALSVVNRALATKLFEPFESIPLRVRRYAALAFETKWKEAGRAAAEVAACVPKGDATAAKYAAWNWVSLGCSAAARRRPDIAVAVFDAALALDDRPQTRELRDEVAPDAERMRAVLVAAGDEELPRWLRLYLHNVAAAPVAPWERWGRLAEPADAIRRDPKGTAAKWRLVERRHPEVHAILRREWLEFHKGSVPFNRAWIHAGFAAVVLFLIFIFYMAARQREREQAPPEPATTQGRDGTGARARRDESDAMTAIVTKVAAAGSASAASVALDATQLRLFVEMDEMTLRRHCLLLPGTFEARARATERVVAIRRELSATRPR